MGRDLINDEAGELQLKRYNHRQDWLFGTDNRPQTPSEWFGKKFTYQQEKFGPPFLEKVKIKHDGQTTTIPLSINEDFFAAILGGQKELKHQVVFFEPEQTWHFLDIRTGNFTPTTDHKLQIVLSQYFIQCAEQMPKSVDVESLFTKFRSDDMLRRIVKRARSLLGADETFFSPESTKKRAKGPEVHEKLARQFVKESIKPAPQRILTVRECFELFCALCRSCGVDPIHPRHFRPMLSDLIRQEFDLGLRKDLLDENHKYQNGWKGLAVYRSEFTAHPYN